MERQLSDLTVVELKALAYDMLTQIDLAQNNLRMINQELTKKLQSPTPVAELFSPVSIQKV